MISLKRLNGVIHETRTRRKKVSKVFLVFIRSWINLRFKFSFFACLSPLAMNFELNIMQYNSLFLSRNIHSTGAENVRQHKFLAAVLVAEYISAAYRAREESAEWREGRYWFFISAVFFMCCASEKSFSPETRLQMLAKSERNCLTSRGEDVKEQKEHLEFVVLPEMLGICFS